MRKLGYAKIGAFDLPTHGQFFWNFRTELEERWDFQRVRLSPSNGIELDFVGSKKWMASIQG